MANASTLTNTIPARVGGLGPVFEYSVSIDTINTDLDIRTPTGNNRLYVVGVSLQEGTATNFTMKSGSSNTQTWELAANQGLNFPITKNSYLFATKAGEKLSVRSSAIIGATQGQNLVLKVVEGTVFGL